MRDCRAAKPDRFPEIRDDIENNGSHGRRWQVLSGLPTDWLVVGGKSKYQNFEEMGENIAHVRILGEGEWRGEKVVVVRGHLPKGLVSSRR